MEKREFGNRLLDLVAELSYTVPVQHLNDAHHRKRLEIAKLVHSECFESQEKPVPKYIQGRAVFLLHENCVVIGFIDRLLDDSIPTYLVIVPNAYPHSEKLVKGEYELFSTKQELLSSL